MSLSSGDILKLVVTMVFDDGNIAQNVFGMLLAGAGGPWDEADILSDVEDYIDDAYSNITSIITNELNGTDIDIYVWDPVDSDFDLVANTPWSWNPSDALQELPRGVAALINAGTVDPDVRGKKYIPGLTEGSNTGNGWSATALSALAQFGSDWVNPGVGAASGATLTPGVWSPTQELFFQMQITFNAPTIPSYQRRRKPGVGI